jgi:hypothetical protein
MEELDQAAPAVENEVQEVETQEVEQGQEETGEDAAGESLEVEQTEEEVEYEGNKYRVPKELKDALLRQADYTKKTQEVAETRRAIEAEREALLANQRELAQAAERQKANVQVYAKLTAIDDQLQQFSQVDWNALNEQDPIQAQKLFMQQSQLRDARSQLTNYLSELDYRQSIETQQKIAKQLEQGEETLAKEIKGWSKELKSELKEYGLQVGFSKEEMSQIYDPKAVKLLHKAFMYDQLIAKTQKKPEPKAEDIKPTKTVTKGTTSTKTPEEMSPAEFNAWRRKIIAQRGR